MVSANAHPTFKVRVKPGFSKYLGMGAGARNRPQ